MTSSYFSSPVFLSTTGWSRPTSVMEAASSSSACSSKVSRGWRGLGVIEPTATSARVVSRETVGVVLVLVSFHVKPRAGVLRPDRAGQRGDVAKERVDVALLGVVSGHPAHDRGGFVPHVEHPLPLQFGDVARL